MTKISQRFYLQNQSWNFERIVELEGRKVKVEIRRNAYDDQSYLRGFVLDPVHLCWNTLVNLPISGACCRAASYGRKDEPIAPFERDAAGILAELKKILS